ncbi:IMPACT family protein [Marinicella litoralis]|uniref:Putative YigZ family protein n=1 Tax=Marinicella litoralis TaxID=644220 RepID=A0A4R6XM69_9GAMM|nr:YigZ family protein [Marinicella litoralis]TDR18383.1 putative YigZ family protein [Marinicella litoralis]
MTKKILISTNTNEEAIKKSLFIGICFPITSDQNFFNKLTTYQDLNATHNCWAYRIGNEYRFNDDGEPSGTAGKPILAAIDGADFDAVGALVIRHYGGIKLGTGGLARAYGGTIAKNLKQADFEFHVPKSELRIEIGFQYSQILHQLLNQYDGISLDQNFNSSGVNNLVELPNDQIEDFTSSLNNHTKGSAEIILIES